MTPTSCSIFCFSPTGTSRKIADAVARGLQQKTAAIRTHDLTRAPAERTLTGTDAVAIFAVPVYGGHAAPTALERLQQVRGDATPAVLVVVYGNRDIGSAATELAAFVAERGFVPVAAGAFVGEHSYSTAETPIAAGRPDRQDLAEAEAFGRSVRRRLETHGTAPVDVGRLRAPRTPLLPLLRFLRFVISYRRSRRCDAAPLLPRTDTGRCSRCGRCAAVCPTQAIARGAEERTDPARCIRCCACVKACPAGARTFGTPFAAVLARNFRRRKANRTLPES